jgi:glycosyltransferase involved in cell wall biosynthesis
MAKYGYQFEALSPFIRLHRPLGNVTFHQVGSFRISPTSSAFHRYVLHSESMFRSLITAKKLLRKRKIDVVHHMLPAVFDYTFSPLALLSKNLKQPFVFGPVSIRYYEAPLAERALLPLTSRLHRATIRRSDRIITITAQTKRIYTRMIDEGRISVIPFGVDTAAFKPAQERPSQGDGCQLLFAGSLYPLKGVNYLIRAMAIARRQGVKANLTIVGEGQQKEMLTTLVTALGIAKHVRFEGLVPYSSMPEYYKQCDIFCFPTLGEPFGKAIVEAMACGKPVIATNAGGPAEIIQDEVDGILVAPSDAEAMAKQIVRLANSESERLRIGGRARETAVKRFSWEAVAEKYHQLYSEIL